MCATLLSPLMSQPPTELGLGAHRHGPSSGALIRVVSDRKEATRPLQSAGAVMEVPKSDGQETWSHVMVKQDVQTFHGTFIAYFLEGLELPEHVDLLKSWFWNQPVPTNSLNAC